MRSVDVWKEIAKWIYGLVVFGMCFLFFCLFLDVFCFLIIGGWNPLLGEWPIFSGTLGTMFYGSWYVTLPLIFGVAAIARLVIWDKMPGLLSLELKHRS